ncbi:MAG: hypothetical protein DYG89_49525 [Caldilinea sp. CFX5]|nr:hypothetical protein [Caldilinea sp. CFX5]
MSIHEIEAAIIRLTPQQLLDLISCLQEYHDKAGEQPQEEDEPEGNRLETKLPERTPLYAAAD